MTTYFELSHGTVIETDSPENWENDPSATRLTRKQGEARHKAQCATGLHKLVKPGDTVYTVLRHVSRSGMRRRIDLYAVVDNEPVYLTGYAAGLMGERVHKDGGIVTDGCGMDMGFNLVYRLGYALWANGTRKPHGVRNGEPDSDGGYALKHRDIGETRRRNLRVLASFDSSFSTNWL